MPFAMPSDPSLPAVRGALAVLARARTALTAKRKIEFLARAFADAARVRAEVARQRFERGRRPSP